VLICTVLTVRAISHWREYSQTLALKMTCSLARTSELAKLVTILLILTSFQDIMFGKVVIVHSLRIICLRIC